MTRGKGLGMGDVKFALPLGLAFGYPDILPVIGFAFICGAIWGIFLIVLKKKTMQGALPLAPFLALSTYIHFLFRGPRGTVVSPYYGDVKIYIFEI